MNDQTPNWVAFRYSKQKMESIKQFATHTRFTCSEDGPFLDLKNYNDYVRVKLSKLDPLTFSADRGRCIRTEFANIRCVVIPFEEIQTIISESLINFRISMKSSDVTLKMFDISLLNNRKLK